MFTWDKRDDAAAGKMGAGTVSVIGCIVSVILIVISYKISVRIMEKKEF